MGRYTVELAGVILLGIFPGCIENPDPAVAADLVIHRYDRPESYQEGDAELHCQLPCHHITFGIVNQGRLNLTVNGTKFSVVWPDGDVTKWLYYQGPENVEPKTSDEAEVFFSAGRKHVEYAPYSGPAKLLRLYDSDVYNPGSRLLSAVEIS